MIQRLVIEGLYDHFNFDLEFHEDLNLLTGRNGSGKTTLMKIMWGMLSGRIGDEGKYPKADNIMMEVEGGGIIFQGKLKRSEEIEIFDVEFGHDNEEFVARWEKQDWNSADGFEASDSRVIFQDARALNFHLPATSRTVFFPTFRRHEGGYDFLDVPQPVAPSPLADDYLGTMVRAANNGPRDYHVFVNYSSTNDIDFILATLQAHIASHTQKLEKEQSDFVLQQTTNVDGDEKAILQAIRTKQEETNAKVAELMKPLTNLSEMITVLFKDKGIQVSGNITLGIDLYTTHSEHLSSGEKQMLSFLAYCSICKNTIIFIDEPELSLSPDWQRLLVPMLLSIPNGNQYFLATHSPFIYAKYPDKDVSLDQDKGGE